MTTNVTTYAAEATTYQARAPGKIILSGEHAVVYGADAIAAAVQQYTTVTFSPVSNSRAINTLFSGISTSVTYPINVLSNLKHRLDARFEQFTRGNLPVQNILNHPNDLLMYTLMAFLQQLPSRQLLKQLAPESGVLRSESTIPVGAGMGSSASAIAATLVLYEDILKKALPTEKLFEMVRFCERLQHGCGSAIDAITVTYGGINRISGEQHQHLAIALDDNWYWLHTGTPSTSTGECVQHVRRNYGYETSRWHDFSDVTKALVADLTTQANPIETLKANHRLLDAIDVVPERTQQLITAIEEKGGGAKVSGAGAVAGNKAGLVLMYLPSEDINADIEALNIASHNGIQSWGKVRIDEQGAMRLPNQ